MYFWCKRSYFCIFQIKKYIIAFSLRRRFDWCKVMLTLTVLCCAQSSIFPVLQFAHLSVTVSYWLFFFAVWVEIKPYSSINQYEWLLKTKNKHRKLITPVLKMIIMWINQICAIILQNVQIEGWEINWYLHNKKVSDKKV